MGVVAQEMTVWINVWGYYNIENTWLFGIEARKRFLKRTSAEALSNAKLCVCDAVQSIVSADTRFMKYKWYTENPIDLDIKAV